MKLQGELPQVVLFQLPVRVRDLVESIGLSQLHMEWRVADEPVEPVEGCGVGDAVVR
jgi:hypothetical protein